MSIKRMKNVNLLLFLSLLVPAAPFLNGCSKEGFYQGMYHGLRQREEMVHPSDEPFPPEQPSYEVYRREREEECREVFNVRDHGSGQRR